MARRECSIRSTSFVNHAGIGDNEDFAPSQIFRIASGKIPCPNTENEFRCDKLAQFKTLCHDNLVALLQI